MPCYPALALLLGSAMAAEATGSDGGTGVLFVIAAVRGGGHHQHRCHRVGNYPAPGDISIGATSVPARILWRSDHMKDLTLHFLRLSADAAAPRGVGVLVGAAGICAATDGAPFCARPLMMVLFFQAARVALVVFDPYLSSRPLAEALCSRRQGKLIVDHHYYTFSSVFFYTDRTALLLNGRFNNLGLRLLRSRRAGCFHRRRAIPRTLAGAGTLLHRGV